MNSKVHSPAVQGSPSGLPWISIGFAAALLLVHVVLGPASTVLIYDRDALLGGQLWRAVTGHLVHADSGHLVWNLAALLILGAAYEGLVRPRAVAYLGAVLAGMISVDLWLLWVEPGWERYCGLSGVLNTLFVLLALELWRKTRSMLALLPIVAATAKIGGEAWLGSSLFWSGGWDTVPGAHLAGIAAGVMFWLCLWWRFVSGDSGGSAKLSGTVGRRKVRARLG